MRARLILAAALAAALNPSPARGFELQRTNVGHDVRWEGPSVDLAIDPSLLAVAYGTADAVHDAARAWSGAGGAPQIHVTNGDGNDAIGKVGRNVAFFVPGGYAPAKGALAITVVAFDDASGRILDADIVVSGAYRFGVLDDRARATVGAIVPSDGTAPSATPATGLDETDTFDLGHVIAHEMGHALGLADTPADTTAVMYRMTAPNDASRRRPNGDDLAGIHALYAATGGGCASASISPAAPDEGTARAAMLVAVAGLLFALLRGRPRARAAVAATLALVLVARLPAVAKGAGSAPHAQTHQTRARVVATELDTRGPLLVTRLTLAVEACPDAHRPSRIEALAWGGHRDGVTQIVGHSPPPAVGDVVDLDAPTAHAARESLLRPALGPAFFAAR